MRTYFVNQRFNLQKVKDECRDVCEFNVIDEKGNEYRIYNIDGKMTERGSLTKQNKKGKKKRRR